MMSGSQAILSILGEPIFAVGDGKRYARQTGFGANKKNHPDGGTNETVAWVIFKPFRGLDVPMEGRVYCERFTEQGVNKAVYSVSLPFLKPERRDNLGRDAVEALKAHIRDGYRAWRAANAGNMPTKAANKASGAGWEEIETPADPATQA